MTMKIRIWPWGLIRRLREEIDKLVADATEIVFERIMLEDGNMEATVKNKLFTKMLAEYTRQVFGEFPEAENYFSMKFSFRGDDGQFYDLVIQKCGKLSPGEKAAMAEAKVKELEAKIRDFESEQFESAVERKYE
jgi:hypothetical protein